MDEDLRTLPLPVNEVLGCVCVLTCQRVLSPAREKERRRKGENTPYTPMGESHVAFTSPFLPPLKILGTRTQVSKHVSQASKSGTQTMHSVHCDPAALTPMPRAGAAIEVVQAEEHRARGRF